VLNANQQSTGRASGTQRSGARAPEAQLLRWRAAGRFVSELGLTKKIRPASLPNEKCAHHASLRERFARHRRALVKTTSAAGNYEKWPQKCGGL
jgi:hypothetical protein